MLHRQRPVLPDERELFSEADTLTLMSRHTAAIKCAHLPRAIDGVAICITVYNEEGSALLGSLHSLAVSIGEIRASNVPKSITVVILVDGIDRASRSMLLALADLLGTGELRKSPNCDLACHPRSIELSELLAFARTLLAGLPARADQHNDEIGSAVLLRGPNAATASPIQLIVGIKNENAGKLDSHWWFYRILCPHLSPRVCIQMDVGTVPSTNALNDMINEFRINASVGAVAASIVPTQPASLISALHAWQFASFTSAVLLEWPAERASGFLSVVPGQLSAFRWDAIKDGTGTEAECTNGGPLEVYFRGLDELSPGEALLYLAEDRVLCREMVARPNAEWTISHVDRATAVTDACDSWPELLRQRRRWCNGYVACRTSFIQMLPSLLFRNGISAKRKVRSCVAGFYHSLMLANDWFTPAISYLLMFFLATGAIELLEAHPLARAAAIFLALATSASIVLQVPLCLTGNINPGKVLLLRISIALQIALIAGTLLVIVFLASSPLAAYLFLFIFLASTVAAMVGQRQLVRSVLLNAPMAVLTTYVVPPLLWAYAICNAHDSSWGTKGLTVCSRTDSKAQLRKQWLPEHFSNFRNRYLAMWLASNLMAALAFVRMYSVDWISAITVLLSITASHKLFGLLCTVGRRAGLSGQTLGAQ